MQLDWQPAAGRRAEQAVRRGIDDETMRRFLEATVAGAFAVPVGELGRPTRCRAPVAFGRQVAMYLAHVALGLTLTDVGRLFGRDRTTAAHACRVVEDRRDDPATDARLSTVELAVAAWVGLMDGLPERR